MHANSDKIRDYTEVIENQIGDNPNNWVDERVKIETLTHIFIQILKKSKRKKLLLIILAILSLGILLKTINT